MRISTLILALTFHGALLAQMGTPIALEIDNRPFSEQRLKEVFLGNKSLWNNGNPVTVVLTSSDSESFSKTANWALDGDAFAYQKHWLSIVFQGRADAPVFLSNEQAVIDYIRNHKGAIGILYQTEAPKELLVQLK